MSARCAAVSVLGNQFVNLQVIIQIVAFCATSATRKSVKACMIKPDYLYDSLRAAGSVQPPGAETGRRGARMPYSARFEPWTGTVRLELTGMTIGTRLYTWLKGERVGEDVFGNRYYRERGAGARGRPRRWVMYKGMPEASKVPPEWHAWLHWIVDTPPTETTSEPRP